MDTDCAYIPRRSINCDGFCIGEADISGDRLFAAVYVWADGDGLADGEALGIMGRYA